MRRALYFWLVLGILISVWSSCDRIEGMEKSSTLVSLTMEPERVNTIRVRSGFMVQSYQAFGYLEHGQKTELAFSINGKLKNLFVKNGLQVRKGEVLASLDPTFLDYDLNLAALELQVAALRKKEMLIQYGGDACCENSVDSLTQQVIALKSGYARAVLDFDYRQQLWESRELIAPFEGIVANLAVQPGQNLAAGQVIADLLNQETLLVRFLVLFSKTTLLRKGAPIIISTGIPGLDTLNARVQSINPQVNQHGLVEVTAQLPTSLRIPVPERLSVVVWLQEKIPAKLIVPKQAILTRAGQQMLFTVDVDRSRAKLHAIEVLDENETEVSISGKLSTDDQVIVSGHTFLTHDAPIVWTN